MFLVLLSATSFFTWDNLWPWPVLGASAFVISIFCCCLCYCARTKASQPTGPIEDPSKQGFMTQEQRDAREREREVEKEQRKSMKLQRLLEQHSSMRDQVDSDQDDDQAYNRSLNQSETGQVGAFTTYASAAVSQPSLVDEDEAGTDAISVAGATVLTERQTKGLVLTDQSIHKQNPQQRKSQAAINAKVEKEIRKEQHRKKKIRELAVDVPPSSGHIRKVDGRSATSPRSPKFPGPLSPITPSDLTFPVQSPSFSSSSASSSAATPSSQSSSPFATKLPSLPPLAAGSFAGTKTKTPNKKLQPLPSNKGKVKKLAPLKKKKKK